MDFPVFQENSLLTPICERHDYRDMVVVAVVVAAVVAADADQNALRQKPWSELCERLLDQSRNYSFQPRACCAVEQIQEQVTY